MPKTSATGIQRKKRIYRVAEMYKTGSTKAVELKLSCVGQEAIQKVQKCHSR